MKLLSLNVAFLASLLLIVGSATGSPTSTIVQERDYDEASTLGLLTYRALDYFSAADSEEEGSLEKRELYKRLRNCGPDSPCPATRYCSPKRQKCYKKRGNGRNCQNDYACQSGYCGRLTGRCASMKGNGSKCHMSNSACRSGYCDATTNKCADKGAPGTPCTSGQQCSSNYCRRNGTCSKRFHNPSPPPPVQT